jgi:hypothetical protein
MKRLSCLLTLLGLSLLAAAQTPPQMPKPSPELKKLDYFSGDWKMEGDMKPGPFGPGGKFTGSEKNHWMDGGFFLVSHSDVDSPMGKMNGVAVFGYKTDDSKFTYHAFNSMGEADEATGMVDGDTWTWTNQEKMAGKVMNGRYVVKVLSPTSYAFKFDIQPEGGDWANVMEGKATRK